MPGVWFWSRDGQTRNGPISWTELQALAQSGALDATDLVWTEGFASWTAAGAVDGLFPSANEPARPVPQRSGGTGSLLAAIGCRLLLAFAVLVSSAAMVCALLGFGGDLLGLSLASGAVLLGVVGILLSLIVVGTGIATGRGRAFIEGAVVSIFLGLSTLLFSIGAALSLRIINEYREIAARAGEVQTERAQAEAARREAKQLQTDAEALRLKAVAEPLEILKKATDTKKQSDDQLAQVESEKIALEKKGTELENEIKLKRAGLVETEVGLKKRQADLAAKELAFGQQDAALVKRTQDVNDKAKQAQRDVTEGQKLKGDAAALRAEAEKVQRDAEDKQREVKAALDALEAKDKEARAYHKKIVEELKNALKPKTKTAVNALERIFAQGKPKDLDLTEVHFDLCEIAVKDAKLRPDVVNALRKTERDLADAAAYMMKPPDGTTPLQFIEKVKDLPTLGAAGLPLLEGVLTHAGAIKAQPHYDYWNIFQATVESLAASAKDDDRALKMLLKAHTGPYALAYEKFAEGHNRLFAMNVANPNPLAPAQYLHPRREVAQQLIEVCKMNPNAQKSPEVVDFFIDLLKETKGKTIPTQLTDENQVLAAIVLAGFGNDAKRALPQLREALKDNSEEVRKVAEDAIQQINK